MIQKKQPTWQEEFDNLPLAVAYKKEGLEIIDFDYLKPQIDEIIKPFISQVETQSIKKGEKAGYKQCQEDYGNWKDVERQWKKELLENILKDMPKERDAFVEGGVERRAVNIGYNQALEDVINKIKEK